MSVGAHLIHTCDLKRATAPNQDGYQANRKTYTTTEAGVACRLTEKTQRVMDTATGEAAIVTTYLMLFVPTADVRVADQVTNITDQRGDVETVASGDAAIFRISALLKRRGRSVRHLSAQLERVG